MARANPHGQAVEQANGQGCGSCVLGLSCPSLGRSGDQGQQVRYLLSRTATACKDDNELPG